MNEIAKEQAQKFILYKQGLIGSSKKSVLDVCKAIHNVQIDTISVVARAQDLTLYNRFDDYKQKEIWNFLKQKKVFEYYSHALCLLPIEEYPFYKWRMEDYKHKEKTSRWEKWFADNNKAIDHVLKRIKKEGALSSKDFKVPEERKSLGWFNWKEEKRALEYLFYCGDLLISHRIGFQKYYDLPERVLPNDIANEPMSIKEIPDYLTKTIFSAIGIGDYEEFRSYIRSRAAKLIWGNKPKKITAFLHKQVDEGLLESVKVEGIEQEQFMLSSEYDKLFSSKHPETTGIKLINPFDNILRDRKLAKKFWNFEYKIEVYVPEAKRIYGYYLMPILYDHKLVGRLEPKAHRKEKILEIKGIFFEEWFIPSENFYSELKITLNNFAQFHNCEEIIYNDKLDNNIVKKLKD